jgi:hypothetical protein
MAGEVLTGEAQTRNLHGCKPGNWPGLARDRGRPVGANQTDTGDNRRISQHSGQVAVGLTPNRFGRLVVGIALDDLDCGRGLGCHRDGPATQPAAARHREQPQLAVADLTVEECQDRIRPGAIQPLAFRHFIPSYFWLRRTKGTHLKSHVPNHSYDLRCILFASWLPLPPDLGWTPNHWFDEVLVAASFCSGFGLRLCHFSPVMTRKVTTTHATTRARKARHPSKVTSSFMDLLRMVDL